jgi:UDP-glucose 4-epimerase
VKAAELNNVKKIIFTSTVAVYGLNKPDPDEKSPTDPFNDYGKKVSFRQNSFLMFG